MKRVWLLATVLLALSTSETAAAEQRFIVRSTLGLPSLQQFCLLHSCSVVRGLDGTLNELFLVTTSDLINPIFFLGTLRLVPGVVDAQLDHVLTIRSGLSALKNLPLAPSHTP